MSRMYFITLCTYVICNVSARTSTTVAVLKSRHFVLQDGWSPLKSSCFNGHLDVVKTLIEAGANINEADKVSTHIPPARVWHHSM